MPGDYVVAVNPPQLRVVMAVSRRLRRVLAPWREDIDAGAGFGIPFVDYARGDGKAIGPGQPRAWTPTLIDDDTPWIRDYRGLWGLDTEDHFGGERAPSGPRYERDGAIRLPWANPLGWAGLEKVPPDDAAFASLLGERIAELELCLEQLDAAIADERGAVRRLSADVRSLEAHDHMRRLVAERRAERDEREAELNRTIAARATVGEELRTHRDTLARPLAAEDVQGHIKSRHGPRSEEQQRRARFLRVWAAFSTPLLLAMVPVILLASPLTWITTLGALILIFAGVEAFARRRSLSFLGSTLLLVAGVALCIAFVAVFQKHWRIALSLVFGAAALVLLAGNLGDLTSGRRHAAPAELLMDESPR